MDRTMLANQRTLLAYIRTALAFLVVGGTAVKFFSSPPIVAAGVVFMILAGILTVVGIAHYRTMQAQIESVKRSPD
jgi:putative membrane protein